MNTRSKIVLIESVLAVVSLINVTSNVGCLGAAIVLELPDIVVWLYTLGLGSSVVTGILCVAVAYVVASGKLENLT